MRLHRPKTSLHSHLRNSSCSRSPPQGNQCARNGVKHINSNDQTMGSNISASWPLLRHELLCSGIWFRSIVPLTRETEIDFQSSRVSRSAGADESNMPRSEPL